MVHINCSFVHMRVVIYCGFNTLPRIVSGSTTLNHSRSIQIVVSLLCISFFVRVVSGRNACYFFLYFFDLLWYLKIPNFIVYLFVSFAIILIMIMIEIQTETQSYYYWLTHAYCIKTMHQLVISISEVLFYLAIADPSLRGGTY